MAHKKGQGASRNGRDSNPQFRGIKTYDGERVKPGAIILRQCGTKFMPGRNVKMAKDCSLFSLVHGVVKFQSNNRVHVTATATSPATSEPEPAPA